jgi:DNA repair protein RecO (recombination protein O)
VNERRARTFRTTALILKRRDFGESDRMLTILSPTHGKLDVLARGARKPLSHKTGHVELYTRSELLISRGREFGQVTQAEMSAPYLLLRQDLTRGAYAHYAVELLDRFTAQEDHDALELFPLLDETFARLCDGAIDPRTAARFYELRLLERVGFRPELHECVIGREPIQPQSQFFSFAEGGAVCPQCAARAGSSLHAVSLDALKLLRHLQRSPFAAAANLSIPPALHDEVERLMLGYLVYLLERRLQSAAFIQRLRAT